MAENRKKNSTMRQLARYIIGRNGFFISFCNFKCRNSVSQIKREENFQLPSTHVSHRKERSIVNEINGLFMILYIIFRLRYFDDQMLIAVAYKLAR